MSYKFYILPCQWVHHPLWARTHNFRLYRASRFVCYLHISSTLLPVIRHMSSCRFGHARHPDALSWVVSTWTARHVTVVRMRQHTLRGICKLPECDLNPRLGICRQGALLSELMEQLVECLFLCILFWTTCGAGNSGGIIFTILSLSVCNSNGAESDLATVATFGAATRSASASLGGASRGSRSPDTAPLRHGHRKEALPTGAVRVACASVHCACIS